MQNKNPPISEQSEISVLGCMILNRKSIPVALSILKSDDFYFSKNAAIFTAIGEMFSVGINVDHVTLMNKLKTVESDYLLKLTDAIPSVKNIDQYCNIVKDKSNKRKLIEICNNQINQCYDDESTVSSIITESNKIVAQKIECSVGTVIGRRDFKENPYVPKIMTNELYIPSGIDTIDYAMNDIRKGYTSILVGRSNGGKSAIVNQIVANGIYKKARIFFVEGEEDEDERMRSIYNCVIGRDQQYVRNVLENKRYKKYPTKTALEALHKWQDDRFTLFDKTKSKIKSTEALFSMLKRESEKEHFDLFIVDNLMSVLNTTSQEKLENQAKFMENCKDLAKIYGTHVMIVMHVNKTCAKNQEPELESILGSSDLQNKADFVLGLVRFYDNDLKDSGIDGRLLMLKNRSYSDLPKVDLKFDTETGLLCEIVNGKAKTYEFGWKKYLPKQEVMQ